MNKLPDLIVDNVSFNGIKSIAFAIGAIGENPNQTFNNLKIMNSDFSNLNLYVIESSLSYDDAIYQLKELLIQNSKINRVYSENAKVIIDCDCEFVNGIKRGRGDLEYEEFFEQNEYTLYERANVKDLNINGEIITSTCKNKTIKITDSILLSKIEEDTGLKIDDTWDINPKGIVEIRDNKIVPLKVGEADITKEINEEVYKLRVKVVSADKESNPIINPSTGSSTIIIFGLILIITISLLLVRKRELN